MQFVLPDGVVNATSSPSCVVTPSRVATWYWAASAGVPPASIQAMTSATGAPGVGGSAGAVVVVGGVVVAELRVVSGGIGVIRWPSPSVDREHPATSNKIAISPAIRVPARLGADAPLLSRRGGEWYSLPSDDARTHRPRDHRLRHHEGFTRDGVNRWRAIPYARPPVGLLRLRAPQPVEPWPGVRYCHSVGYCAPQQRMYTILAPGKYQPMSEDCLTLNVVAPKSPPDTSLPVMVFIHGAATSWEFRRPRSTTARPWRARAVCTCR